MPHECTACGRQFADGSKEMLSGCPDCGGTKFQFNPPGGAPAAEEPPDPPTRDTGNVTETVGLVTTKLRDFVGDNTPSPGGDDGRESEADEVPPTAAAASAAEPPREVDAGSTPEGGAQSTARTEMVSTDELPGHTPSAGTTPGEDGQRMGPVREDAESEGRVVDTPADDSPDLSELREELNDQFEGIRISEPGQYELNLMELYEREETIIALQENGRYVIEPPESWAGDERV